MLKGKGFFIWQVKNCERGDALSIAAKARAANLSHVLLKIADGPQAFGYDNNNNDVTAPVVLALRKLGVQVWGWHYVRGDDPSGEARVAIQRIRQLSLDGYVADAEGEYKTPAKAGAARTFMTALRNSLGNLPIALSSYRFPSFHKDFPWAAFLEQCTFTMPQVYWEQAHNPDVQLQRSVTEFGSPELVGAVRPFIATGSAYGTGGWRPSADDIRRFLAKCRELGVPAANFYSWDWATSTGNTDLWDAAAGYDWPFDNPGGQPADIVTRYFAALNSRDLDSLFALYQPNAAYVTAQQTIAGNNAIFNNFYEFLYNRMPNAGFSLLTQSGQDATRVFAWTAHNGVSRIQDGNDTFGLRDGLIQYHYSRFTQQP